MEVFHLWQNNRVHELYAQATPGLAKAVSEDDLQVLVQRIAVAVGTCAAPTTPPEISPMDGNPGMWRATAVVACTRAKLKLALIFHITETTSLLHGFNVEPTPAPKPDATEGVKLARSFLDEILAANIDHFADELDPRALNNMGEPAKFRAQLAKIAAEAGKVGEVRQVTATPDGDSTEKVVYDVAAAKHHLTATITTEFQLARWLVTDFDIAPVKAKKP
jgi:hypothetical protein